MKTESWQAYNPNAICKYKLGNRLRISYRITNDVISRAREIDADIVDDFIKAFQTRIAFVEDVEGVVEIEKILEPIQDYENLKDNHELAILVTKYMFYHLKIPMKLDDLKKEIEVTSFYDAVENERIRYYQARAGSDIFGDEEGIEFWKKITALRLHDSRVKYEEQIKEAEKSGKKPKTLEENSDRAIEWWIGIGLGDFTRRIIDDHKIHYRFDKCRTYEVLKDLDDPEYAYISSCYVGDHPDANFPGRHQFLRRTQTLHHGKFCDELYWDPKVHEDPEQPSLEFTEKM